jgi:hypothetical protein
MKERKTEKIVGLLAAHKSEVIERLGASAFELLTPRETAELIGIPSNRIPDIIRQGWLEPVPGKDVGQGHQYYRWRVVFVQQYRKGYKYHADKNIDNTIS